MPHELLSPNAASLVKAKAYVLFECRCGVTVGGINWQRNLILRWGSTAGSRRNPDRPTLEGATAQDQDEMVTTLNRDAKILVADQPDFPDVRVTHLEEALEDLSDHSATEQFECRGRVQDCSRGFLLLAGHSNIANSWTEIVTAAVERGGSGTARRGGGLSTSPTGHNSQYIGKMPITRGQALEVAQDYVVTHRSEAFTPSRRVVDLDELRRERRREPAMYWVSKVSLEECWLVYCSGSDLPGLFSSTLVAVSKHTGEVVYAGSAHDEG